MKKMSPNNSVTPGDRVQGVLGQPVGEVIDVAANAIFVAHESGHWWLDSNVVLLVRGGTVVLKCPAKFTAQYRLPGGPAASRRNGDERSSRSKV
jgi:hypothetical protein